jgi:hypothetical protein
MGWEHQHIKKLWECKFKYLIPQYYCQRIDVEATIMEEANFNKVEKIGKQ